MTQITSGFDDPKQGRSTGLRRTVELVVNPSIFAALLVVAASTSVARPCGPQHLAAALAIALAGEMLMRVTGLPAGTAWLDLAIPG